MADTVRVSVYKYTDTFMKGAFSNIVPGTPVETMSITFTSGPTESDPIDGDLIEFTTDTAAYFAVGPNAEAHSSCMLIHAKERLFRLVKPGDVLSFVGLSFVPVKPDANNDTVEAINGEDTIIEVLANDVAASYSIDPSSVTIATPPSEGEATVQPDGTIIYVGELESEGDSFTYTVKDIYGLESDPATVTITSTDP